MNLPLLLLGLYLGLLALSLVLSSWVGHSTPPPEAARRVTNAAERAAMIHLIGPFRLALAAAGLSSAVLVTHAALREGPIWLASLFPVLGPALVFSAIYFCCRKQLRASGQLVGASGADARVSLSSRTLLASVLCADSCVSLVLLGAYTLVSSEHGNQEALRLVTGMAASLALMAAVFARASAGAILSTRQDDTIAGPHPGSLAALVATAFHAPCLRLLSLVTLSALGHCLLLAFLAEEGNAQDLWLYPHLLKVLGLVALAFGALSVRTSEDEAPGVAWIRGGLVSFALLVAGAWSLSSELPEQWTRSVPSGLTFFFATALVFVLLSRATRERNAEPSVAQGQLPRISATLCWVALLLVLVFSVHLLPDETRLPEGALLRLLVAAALAAAPLSVLWLMARDLASSSRHVRELSDLGGSSHDASPPFRLLPLFPLLTLVTAASALGGMALVSAPGGQNALLQTLGLFTGAITLWGLMGLAEKNSERSRRDLNSLVEHHQRQKNPAEKLNLEVGVDSCRKATTGGLGWLLLTLAPLALTLLLCSVVPATEVRPLALGMALGAGLLGLGLDWGLGSSAPAERSTIGALSHATSLSQILLLVALGAHLT